MRRFSMPNAFDRCTASMSVSTKEPGSSSASMRSLAVSLPLSCWVSTACLEPACSACSLRLRSSSMRSFMVFGCIGDTCTLPGEPGARHGRSLTGMGQLDAYAAGLRAALPPFFSPLEVIERVPTTMARAAELGEAGAPEGATVVVEEQTAGRGRLGRSWVAPTGTGLLVSVLLRPTLPARDLWLVASLAGVALVDAVD